MLHINRVRLIITLLFVAILSACGGGGGGAGSGGADDIPPANATATAHAGNDQYVSRFVSVMLDGSASSDPDGDVLTYEWKQINGPDVTDGIGSLSGVNPDFISPDTASTLSFELRVNDGHTNSTPDIVEINVLGETVSDVVIDAEQRLPVNQARLITQNFLDAKFSEAFARILNSPDDSLKLSIGGTITVLVPVPFAPPGLFNGGISVSKTIEITSSNEVGVIYYDVSFEREDGISFGVGVPGLPAGTEVSVGEGISISTTEVFRFTSPADAAKGMMNYFILKGLWQELNTLGALGIDATDLANVAVQIREYILELTGLDFGLTLGLDELNAALDIAYAAVWTAQFAVDSAQDALDLVNATVDLDAALAKVASAQATVTWQRGVVKTALTVWNNCVDTWGYVLCWQEGADLLEAETRLLAYETALGLANTALGIVQDQVTEASNLLADASVDLEVAEQKVIEIQAQIASLPDDTSVDIFTLLLTETVAGIEFLNQHHHGSSVTISRALAGEGKVDKLGGAAAKRVSSFSLTNNVKDKILGVTIHFSSELAVAATISGLVGGQTLTLKKDNGVEYELVFEFNSQSGFFELKDSGTFKLYADLSGSMSGNQDAFHLVAGAGVKPIIEFKPGEGLSEFGAAATGIIDISPIVGLVRTFPGVNFESLLEAAVTIIGSFDVDELITVLSEQTLPLQVKHYRTAGFESKISAGSSGVMTGELSAAAIWSDYGETLDYSSMTVADFSSVIFDSDGLLSNVDDLVSVIKEAYDDVAQ